MRELGMVHPPPGLTNEAREDALPSRLVVDYAYVVGHDRGIRLGQVTNVPCLCPTAESDAFTGAAAPTCVAQQDRAL